jgi:hypothetical protein
LDDQLAVYINEWRKQKNREEDELKALKDRQVKRRVSFSKRLRGHIMTTYLQLLTWLLAIHFSNRFFVSNKNNNWMRRRSEKRVSDRRPSRRPRRRKLTLSARRSRKPRSFVNSSWRENKSVPQSFLFSIRKMVNLNKTRIPSTHVLFQFQEKRRKLDEERKKRAQEEQMKRLAEAENRKAVSVLG